MSVSSFANDGPTNPSEIDYFKSRLVAVESFYINNIASSETTTSERYELTKVSLPFPNYFEGLGKPVAYVENLNQYQSMVVSGAGEFFIISRDVSPEATSVRTKRIPTNLNEIESVNIIRRDAGSSIKDILLFDNYLYLTSTSGSQNCIGLKVLRAPVGKYIYRLIFEPLTFRYQCIDKNIHSNVNPHEGGGRLHQWNDNILLTVGDYGVPQLAKQQEQIFGKLLLLDPLKLTYKLIVMGLRNPQGLEVFQDTAFVSQHGQKGGDEINSINLTSGDTANWGWPIVSYGLPYESQAEPSKPNYSDHRDMGFREPLYAFQDSAGISQLIVSNCDQLSSSLLVGTLGYDSNQYRQKILEFNNKTPRTGPTRVIYYNERIRDIQDFTENPCAFSFIGEGKAHHMGLPAFYILTLK